MGDKETETKDSVVKSAVESAISASNDPPSFGPSLPSSPRASKPPNVGTLVSFRSQESYQGAGEGAGGGTPVPVGKDEVVEHSPQGR